MAGLALTLAVALAAYAALLRPVTVGVVFSVDNALGNEANLAIRALQAETIRVGLRPLRFLVRNPPLEEARIADAFRELDEAGVSAIIGGAISQEGIVLAREAGRAGVPTIGTTTSSDLVARRKDGFYRLVMGTEALGALAADYLASLGLSRVAVVRSGENLAYAQALAESVVRHLGEGARLVPYDGGRFEPTLRAEPPDAVFLVLPPHELVQAVRLLRGWPEPPPIVSSEWAFAFTPFLFAAEMEGVEFVSQNGVPSPPHQAWIEEFRRRYKQATSYSVEYTLSVVELVRQAAAAVGTDRGALNAYFGTPRVYEYVYGKVYVDEFGDALHDSLAVWEVVEGRPRLKSRRPVRGFPGAGHG